MQVTIKAGQAMRSLEPEMLSAIFNHPAHRDNVMLVTNLVGYLQQCNKPEEYRELQEFLFTAIYKAEERRAQCARIIKRFRSRKPLPQDAPPSVDDPNKLETWQFELYVYDRIVRQLRVVGDGLAWRSVGYNRRIISAMSRNSSPGVMYGKSGLGYELGRVQDLWETKRHFGLLHDLTNCMRIADITEFTSDGDKLLHEVKTVQRTEKRPPEKRQLKRMQEAVDAVMNGGALPGGHPGARLVELSIPYVTDIGKLGDLIQLARRHGCRGTRLPQGRALVVTSVLDAVRRWNDDIELGMRTTSSIRQRAIIRAGIADSMHHIQGISGDTASRSPIMAPWSIYPFDPEDCAALICDLLTFETVISADALAGTLRATGLEVDVLLPMSGVESSSSVDILRIRWKDRTLTLHNDGLTILLYELVQPETWAAGIKEVLTQPAPPAEPVLVFTDEAGSWSPPQFR